MIDGDGYGEGDSDGGVVLFALKKNRPKMSDQLMFSCCRGGAVFLYIYIIRFPRRRHTAVLIAPRQNVLFRCSRVGGVAHPPHPM